MKRIALLALVLAAALAGPGQAAAPTCLTVVAPHEPPCNPHLADSGWGASHRNSYASGASGFPAPPAGSDTAWQHVLLPGATLAVPIIIDFTSTYPDGGRAAFMSVVSRPDTHMVAKVDVATGEVISTVTEPPALQGQLISGAYNLLDRDNHLFVGRERSLDVIGDTDPAHRESPIAKLKSLTLPDRALCGADDRLVGITMTFDGHVVYASQRGAVGLLPRRLADLSAGNVRVLQLNAGRCGESDDSRLEIVSNSISADETGGIYVVTSKHMQRLQWDGRTLRRRWTGDYDTGGAASGVRLGEGSGSTPDVMGTSHDKDRFVVITDGAPLMKLVLFWRDRIPAGWKPIAPGKDRRIACEVPVTFGDPAATASSSEQSVLTSGYMSFIVNNTLKDESAFAGLPAQQRQIAAALAGGDPLNAPYGMERIDWDPRTRTCHSVWANREVSIPNGVPTLSTASGLVYGQGQRLGVWGLEGLDIATGRSELRVDTAAGPQDNSIYAATEVGPDGSIWQGVGGGIDIYRGPAQRPPRFSCFDLERPVLRALARGLRISGRATDRACGEPARVTVRVAGRRVPLRGGRFRARVRRLPAIVRATDAAGQRTSLRLR